MILVLQYWLVAEMFKIYVRSVGAEIGPKY